MKKVKGLRKNQKPQRETTVGSLPEGNGDGGSQERVRGIHGDGKRHDLGW